MAQNYECMLLLEPSLDEATVQSHLEQFTNRITQHGGELLHTQMWGNRRLEYPILGQTEAIFAILHFRMDSAGALVEEFERLVRITDGLLREMTVKVPELKIMEAQPPLWSDLRSRPRPGRGGRPMGGGRRFDSRSPRPEGETSETSSDESDESDGDTDEPAKDDSVDS